jgi:hypothetical protein
MAENPGRPLPARQSSDSAADDALLVELRERYTYALDQWKPIRDAAKEDMRVVGGDPWAPKDRRAREDAGRVCLSLDELHQYFNQLINEVRANPRAPKFDPTGNGANAQTAEFYQGKMREIEYRSQAQIAYTTAFQNAVHQSYGWLRFNTKYQPKGFVQDLWIDSIENPDLVLSDPDALRPSSSDQTYLFYLQSRSIKEFRREFPNAQVTNFTPEVVSQAPAWITPERVQVAEYWVVEPVTKELVLLQLPNGQTQGFYTDELDQMPTNGAKVVDRRQEQVPEVCMYLTNGVEILKKPGQEKRQRWAGKYIPFVSCFGMVIYVDEGSGPKRKILSMTRLARDPYMLYCYYRTCQAELVGMTPKIPYFVRRGSLKPDQLANLAKSLHEPISVIEVEAFIDGMPGQPPEFPVRNPYEPFIQNLEIGAESARRAIQAAMGISPLPTQAQRRNDKSGVALQQIESSQQKGSFHFIDHYNEMLHQGAVIVEDLIPKVYDTPREVGVRDAKDNAKTVSINNPQMQRKGDMPNGVAGDHTVTISEGPAFESQRAEGAAFTDTLVSNLQMIAQVSGPKAAGAVLGLAVKLKNLGEIGDEIAKIVTPPEYAEQDGQDQIPPQIKAALQQMGQENQQLKQAIQSKVAEKQAEAQAKGQIDMQKQQLEGQQKLQQLQLEQQGKERLAWIQQSAQIAIAGAKIDAEEARTFVDAVEQRSGKALDLHMEHLGHAQDALHAAAQMTHEKALSEQEHEQALREAQVGHQQALEQASQGQQHALEQGQQAADLAPEPAEPSA